MRVISELEECVGSDSGASLERVQASFGKFVTAVRAQLDGDAKRRLFRELPAQSPHLTGRIEALRSQRVHIRSELDALAGAMREPREASAEQTRKRVRSLIGNLRDLENGETKVLQSAYWRETGGEN